VGALDGRAFMCLFIQDAKHLKGCTRGQLIMHEVIRPHAAGLTGTGMRRSLPQRRFLGRRFVRFNPILRQSRQTPLTFVSVITALRG
jgi:hypothetical protein